MESSPRTLVPLARPIVTYWQVKRPNGQTLSCTSYRTAAGLELRVEVEGESAVLQAGVVTHADAHRLAEAWRQKITRSPAA